MELYGVCYLDDRKDTLVITMCVNKGNIKTTDLNRLGGIAGVVSGGTLEYIYNSGSVIGKTFKVNEVRKAATGGLIGITYKNITLKYSYNVGAVSRRCKCWSSMVPRQYNRN